MANEIVNGQITDAVKNGTLNLIEANGTPHGSLVGLKTVGSTYVNVEANGTGGCSANSEKLLSFREVCECVAKGEALEHRIKHTNLEWQVKDGEDISMTLMDYRRKPTKTVKPWTFDAPLLGLHIKEKSGSGKGVITYQMKQYVYLSSGIKSYQALLEDYEQLDGRPCGVEVEDV